MSPNPTRSSPPARAIRRAAVVAALVAPLLAACGGSGATSGRTGQTSGGSYPLVIAHVALGGSAYDLPGRAWAVSFDAWLPPHSRLAVGLGYGSDSLTLASAGRAVRVVLAGRSYTLAPRRGWLGGGRWHVEATNTRLSVDGRPIPVRASTATAVTFAAAAGRPKVAALIATASADRGLLLLHRLAELHARIPAGQFPEGATVQDTIVEARTYWTSGFWPGALWQAAAIAPADGLFASWARTATIEHFGDEHAATHDVGFMYGQSSLAAWQALCAGRESGATAALCARLRRSVLAAAGELLALAASNPGAGAIPTDPASPEGDTIIDSMMNIAILPWATRVTGDEAYARLAAHHAHVVARLLVRPDGSTAQAVYFDRSTGRVLSVGTHQGISATSTWSRGQGWAVYGFAQAALALHDPALLRVAVRAADYVASRLPAGGIPRWDYDAPGGAPVDVSAGVITAAGLFRLSSACRTLSGVCSREAGGWSALGQRMLTAALGRASGQPPLGFLGSQVLNERGRGCWCNGGELIFGLTYALEGVRLERMARSLHPP